MSAPSGPPPPRGKFGRRKRDKAKEFAEREDTRTGDPGQSSSPFPPPQPSASGDGPPDLGQPDPDGGQQSTQEDKPEQDVPSSSTADPKLYTQAEFDSATRVWRAALSPADAWFRAYVVGVFNAKLSSTCVGPQTQDPKHYYRTRLQAVGEAACRAEVEQMYDSAVELWRKRQSSN
jgi:hypothetical protein